MKADIFFFITSVVVILLAILVAVMLVYIVRILRDVKHISSRVREEGDKIIEDVDELRQDLSREGAKFTGVVSVFSGFLSKQAKKLKVKKTK